MYVTMLERATEDGDKVISTPSNQVFHVVQLSPLDRGAYSRRGAGGRSVCVQMLGKAVCVEEWMQAL